MKRARINNQKEAASALGEPRGARAEATRGEEAPEKKPEAVLDGEIPYLVLQSASTLLGKKNLSLFPSSWRGTSSPGRGAPEFCMAFCGEKAETGRDQE